MAQTKMFPRTLTIRGDTLSYQNIPDAMLLFFAASLMSGVFALIQGVLGFLNSGSAPALSSTHYKHAVVLAILSCATGVFCAIYRERFSIDRKAGTISVQNGEQGFYLAKTFQLADVTTLVFSSITIKPGKGTEFPAFILRIKIRDQEIDLLWSNEESEAHQMARQIAEFAGLPILNTGSPKIRDGTTAAMYPPPPEMRSRYSVNGDNVVIEIQPTGKLTTTQLVHVVVFFCFLVGFISLSVLAMHKPLQTGKQSVVAIIYIAGDFILSGFFYLEVRDLWARCFETVILEASPNALRLTRKRPSKCDVKEYPALSVVQIQLWNDKFLVIDGRKGVEFVGQGLPRVELEWIRAMLVVALSRPVNDFNEAAQTRR